MSLFQARCYWNASPGSDEDADAGCLCVANIDNESSNAMKIITAGHSGILRIYKPNKREYKIEDLVLEMDMDAPIIQIAAGLFVNGSWQQHLAILHPNKLCVYAVACNNYQQSLYAASLCYFHALRRPPYSMCHGPFGGGAGAGDYFCVQSLDGVLSFFEQESYAFSRQLPNFLIPGVLTYCPKLELFLHGSSEMTLDAYRYSKLSSAADNTGDAGERVGGKKVAVDWCYNLGEHAIHIEVVKNRSGSGGTYEICVVGEFSLFFIKETGSLRTMKRLVEDIAVARCFTTDDYSNILIATHTGHLLVYKEMQLIWCAHLQSTGIPVDIAVAEMCGIKGMITTLEQNGRVQVSYLGTDPPSGMLVNTEMKELDYEMMENEHQELLRAIRQCHLEGRSEPKEKLEITLAGYPDSFDRLEFGDFEGDVIHQDGVPLQVSLTFCLHASGGCATNLTVTVRCRASCFLSSIDSGVDIAEVDPSSPTSFSVTFWMRPGIMCSSLDATMAVSFFSPSEEPRCATIPFRLPIWFVARAIPPVKNANFKLHFDTSTDISLSSLFADLINRENTPPQVSATANILSVQYLSGNTPVTVLFLKSAQRLSIQGGEFSSLWLLCDELKLRLQAFNEKVVLTFQDSLPLQDFFSLVDDNFTLRRHIEILKRDLEDRMAQYRVVQKRLLVRYKDRNPPPMCSLDVLLQLTFENLVQLLGSLGEAEKARELVACHLSAAIELMLFLMNSRFGFDEENAQILRLHFSPEVDLGWEENVCAALTELLRTRLARSAQEPDPSGKPNAALDGPVDTARFKRQLTEVIDRLATGCWQTQERAESSDEQ
eukprot:GEMP01012097.1.p1 GENE.GEMP01012097.1~~GEMP01012097.1.p1  ORF type:complete len:826 (+),score=167.44 GEMP01012097.1:49-2526(+)